MPFVENIVRLPTLQAKKKQVLIGEKQGNGARTAMFILMTVSPAIIQQNLHSHTNKTPITQGQDTEIALVAAPFLISSTLISTNYPWHLIQARLGRGAYQKQKGIQ